MENIAPPKYVLQVLRSLKARGYVAYLVGGCVRDMVMGVHPNDWDICTSALPEQVLEVFPKARPTGIRHGTVTVDINSRHVEVTTFRSEGDYADHRHPNTVHFVGELTTDLSRRDFTINAIYLSKDSTVSDFHDGIRDLSKRVLRFIGDPWARVQEDPLRICRGERLASRLGLSLEERTAEAFRRGRGLLDLITPAKLDEERKKGWVG